jgi:hypothetical protein
MDFSGKIEQKHFIDLGNNSLNYDLLINYNDLVNQSKQTKQTNSITRILYSTKHIFLEGVFEGKVKFLVYEKSSKQLFEIDYSNSETFGIQDDIQNIGSFLPKHVSSDGNFVLALSYDELFKDFESLSFSNYPEIKRIVSRIEYGQYLIRIFKY